ncbi:hypothetical protein BGZ92_003781 [Podila epicladia]|nr:hypothetical protein BGZ92_003781 [Podila epicladia]
MYENDETGATDEMDETDDLDDALSPSNSHQFILPQHVHFSNHTGYDLVRSQEFFQTYGFYILMVLKMVRDGFSSDDHEIPSLENFEILWGVDLDGCGGYLTKDTIGTLVSKAINYLEGLKLQKYRSEVWLKESECVAIKDFLVVPSGNNTLGGLYRRSNVISFPTAHHQYANVFRIWTWTCKQHAHQWITPGSHKALEDFVYGCGGHVDLQLATVSIKLQSKQQAEVFCNLLEKTGQRFHVLITLDWNTIVFDALQLP